MSKVPVVAQAGPYKVELEEGRRYAWCRCGLSKNQPFCDGAHNGTDMVPLPFTAEKSGPHYLCGCKQTANQPMCDGAHTKLDNS